MKHAINCPGAFGFHCTCDAAEQYSYYEELNIPAELKGIPTMPKCKKDGCYEEALPSGKRYCKMHKQEYLQKRKDYLAIQATRRKCIQCGDPLTALQDRLSLDLCGDCAYINAAHEHQAKVRREFDLAETVDELKDWIRTHTTILDDVVDK